MFRGTFNVEDVNVVVQGFVNRGWRNISVEKIEDGAYFITAIY